jgi:hypothetical protein
MSTSRRIAPKLAARALGSCTLGAVNQRARTIQAALAGGAAVTLAVAVTAFWIAFDNGSYGLATRSSIAIVAWWVLALAVALGVLPLARPSRLQLTALGLLVGFGVWTAIGLAWSSDRDGAYQELARVILYIAVFALCLAVVRRSDVTRWCDGIAIAVVAVAVAALASQFLPHVISADTQYRFLPGGRTRLNYPVGYWNGLGIMLGMAVPLLLRIALAARSRAVRAAAVAALPVLGTAIYLTSSRGAVATAFVGAAVYFCATRSRLATIGVLAAGGLSSAIAIAYVRAKPELVNEPGTRLAVEQGRVAVLILVAAALFAAGQMLLLDIVVARLTPSPRFERYLLIGIAIVAVVIFAAANPRQRFETFKAVPTQQVMHSDDFVQSHLLSGSGNGRWQYWVSAVDEFKAHPVIGGGVSSFRQWWERHRPALIFVVNAHSLYLETLGELGIVGFLLVAAFIGVGVTAAARLLRRNRAVGDRADADALTAAFAAFAVALGIDWMWQLTAVALIGLALLALLLAREADDDLAARTACAPRVLSGAVVVVAAAAIVLELLPLLSSTKLGDSMSAASNGDGGAALAAADDARRLEPWSAAPYLQLALLDEQMGRLGGARSHISDAIARDPHNWTLWVTRARLETKSGRIAAALASLGHAKALNPLAVLPQT